MSEQSGRGHLKVSMAVWPDMGSPETPEQWHTALLLPDAYVIEQVEREGFLLSDEESREVFVLTVKHPALPAVAEGGRMPLITPIYRRIYSSESADGTLRHGDVLDHIDIEIWQHERWEIVHTDEVSQEAGK